MCMCDGTGQSVCRIRSFNARGGQQALHHRLYLLLAGMARADDAFLDMVRRVFRDLQSGLRPREQRDGAGVTQFQRSARILRHKSHLDRDSAGAMLGNHGGEQTVQHQKPPGQLHFRVAGQNAMGHMAEARSRHVDHAPAHAAKAGIETKNANRACGHEAFVPFPFAWFNAAGIIGKIASWKSADLAATAPRFRPSALAAWACPTSTVRRTKAKASPRSMPRWMPGSTCSTPATSTAWATTRC